MSAKPECHDDERARQTWAQFSSALQEMAWARGDWAGVPMPMEGTRLRLEPRWPNRERLEALYLPMPHERKEGAPRRADRTDLRLRNRWRAQRLGLSVSLYQGGDPECPCGGLCAAVLLYLGSASSGLRARMLLDTIGAARAWDLKAEIAAMGKLSALVSDWAWRCYWLTGSFLETSRRSGVTYIFRRLRPTLAIQATADGENTKILAALCLHPIGYYDGSWAGAMVPTDDVIAHLLLMRADEHRFWRQANQHTPAAAEAGL